MLTNEQEETRSKVWRIVMIVSSLVIVAIAAFFLNKMFNSNPLVGTWSSEESDLILAIDSDGVATATYPGLLSEDGVTISTKYLIDTENKIISFEPDESQLEEIVEQYSDDITMDELTNEIDAVDTSYEYSLDDTELTLIEQELGGLLVLEKQ